MAGALGTIPFVLFVYSLDVRRKFPLKEIGKQCDSVFAAFSGSNNNLASIEIDVLDSEAGTFEQAETCSIEKRRHELVDAFELVEQGGDLADIEYDGEGSVFLGSCEVGEWTNVDLENLAVEEDQRAKGLVLSGGADISFGRERREEGGDLRRAEFAWVSPLMKEYEPCDPGPIGFLGTRTEMAKTNRSRELVAKLRAEARCATERMRTNGGVRRAVGSRRLGESR